MWPSTGMKGPWFSCAVSKQLRLLGRLLRRETGALYRGDGTIRTGYGCGNSKTSTNGQKSLLASCRFMHAGGHNVCNGQRFCRPYGPLTSRT